jgi:hypothetical protein
MGDSGQLKVSSRVTANCGVFEIFTARHLEERRNDDILALRRQDNHG